MAVAQEPNFRACVCPNQLCVWQVQTIQEMQEWVAVAAPLMDAIRAFLIHQVASPSAARSQPPAIFKTL